MSAEAAPSRILVVDDSPDTREVVRRNLTAMGYQVLSAPGVPEALRVMEGSPVDLVITDLKMPGINGLELIRHIRENLRDVETIMITGYPTVEGAVEAVKTGAEEYLAKPFTDEELASAVERALEKLRLRRASTAPAAPSLLQRGGIVGESEAILSVLSAVPRAAASEATVLITGESGTGKELVARAIHYNGPRASAPFIAVNCGGIPEGLVESELFGHMRGAFTGAIDSRAGFFQAADGGTIFLDEIGDISPAAQVKLLRVLQDREVTMVGSTKPRKVNVRIIAATNKDLRALVKKQTFREDLFFRINVVSIDLPPLRERGDDVLILLSHAAERFARESGRPAPVFTDAALQALKSYQWPGNIRELENFVQRLMVMSESDRIDVPDLPSHMRFSATRAAGAGLDRSLAAVETEHIRNVLDSVGGNKTRAAEILGIDRKTLREKLKALSADAE
jgi:DNA-binding NtrC family response regulator